MKDIVPELLEKLRIEFDKKYKSNNRIRKLEESIINKKATYKEANEYSQVLGDILADVYMNNISSNELPKGKMWFNIAKGVVEPTLKQNYDFISEYAKETQGIINSKNNIGIKPIKATLNQDRIDGIINRVSNEDEFEKIRWILDEPVKNFSQSIIDDTIKTNAEFHSKSGLQPKIIRRESGHCCDWCKSVVGVYKYPKEVPKDVYKRHRYCRCTVEYVPGDGRIQDVHSKQWTDSDIDDKIKERKKESEKFVGISSIRKKALQENIVYKKIKKHDNTINEKQIIDTISGGDKTEGSCSSIALAYVGNKSGYAVKDYRGGQSQRFFASRANIRELMSIDGIKGEILVEKNDFTAVNKFKKIMELDKEYYLATGGHAAIVKKTEEGFKYLELQSNYNNGFFELNNDVLKYRFGCKKSHTFMKEKYEVSNFLIDVDSLKGNEEFHKILGFIDTNQENKGDDGDVK